MRIDYKKKILHKWKDTVLIGVLTLKLSPLNKGTEEKNFLVNTKNKIRKKHTNLRCILRIYMSWTLEYPMPRMNTKSHHDKAFKTFTVKYDHIVQVLLYVLRIPSNLYLLSFWSLIYVFLDVLKATLCCHVGYTFFGRSHDDIAYYAF